MDTCPQGVGVLGHLAWARCLTSRNYVAPTVQQEAVSQASTAEAKKRIKARETTRKDAKTQAEADPF